MMKRKLKDINKRILLTLFCLALASCGGSSIFSRSTLDPYTVTKKTPLIMPPDMLLRPPGKEDPSIIKRNSATQNSFTEVELSVDDILLGDGQIKKKSSSKKKINIISNILKTKPGVILK